MLDAWRFREVQPSLAYNCLDMEVTVITCHMLAMIHPSTENKNIGITTSSPGCSVPFTEHAMFYVSKAGTENESWYCKIYYKAGALY